MTAYPSDEDLLAHLRNVENSSVERKSAGDYRDVLPTAVAFANSQPDGAPGFIFVPVRNDGTVESANLDNLGKKVANRLNQAYPPLQYDIRLLTDGEATLLAVLICGSTARPHFAGPAYIRVGSETQNASQEQFAALIAGRSSKVREIQKWLGKKITVELLRQPNATGPRSEGQREVTVRACNEFYVSVEGLLGPVIHVGGVSSGIESRSFALSRVEISYDHAGDRLSLEFAGDALFPRAPGLTHSAPARPCDHETP